MGSKKRENEEEKKKLEKSYFDVLGLCCSSEVPLIEKILKPLDGVEEVSVIVPSRTVIVVHDISLVSQEQIVKALNQARLEANVRVKGKANYKARWPSPFVILSGLFLALSFLKYVYHPLQYLAVAAVAVGIWPILLRGVIAIRNFTLDVNILMIIAVICTIAMRDYTEAGTIVFLFTIAEWLESRASQKATAVMSSLLSMAPQKATIAETGEVVNVEDVKLNTVVAVKAGEMIPVDGIVVDGTCEVDEKTLTGESYPVPKQNDSQVWAGTVNVNGYISVKTTALAEDSAVAKMARLVEEAQNSRSNVQRLIDRCAKYYTPAVVLISLGLAVVPAILKVHNLKHWFYLALVVLVSACPCGLILSTPVATFCALSRAATSGLLIKGGDYLETLAKIKTIAFDKTGTITRGEFTLIKFQTLADDVSLSTLLYWVSSIESKSSHPIASVLVDYGRSQSIEPTPENVSEFQNFPGEGVFARIDGRDLYIGNKKLAQKAKCNIESDVRVDTKEGATSGYIFSGGVLIGTFHLSDNCRTGAVEAIRELKAMGIRTAMLTGDNQSAAMHAQLQLGNALDVVHAELLPEDKASIITGYKKNGLTAMVGDGVNDAPALATADVGISMGVSGSALATETGHVILMSNDIRKIPKAIKLARKTRRKVIENIFISILTKAFVLASAIAWHPLVWLAVLADVFTCLIVIFNSMLLLSGRHKGHSHGHKHGRKWFRFFSCHSHKSKCHSTGHHSEMNQQCCSKPAPPKICESARCTSQKSSSPCQTTSCHTTSGPKCGLQKSALELKKSVTCSSHNHASSKARSTKSLHLSKSLECCSVKGAHTISESSRCLLEDCSSSCEASHEHVPECESKSGACGGNVCAPSDSQKKSTHEYHQSTCCHDDLESQISCDAGDLVEEGVCCSKGSCESDKHETLSECQHEHPKDSHQMNHHTVHNEHRHEQKACCEGIVPSKVDCGAARHNNSGHHHVVHNQHHHEQQTCCEGIVPNKPDCAAARHNISRHHHSDVLPHQENNVSACTDLCSGSNEIHGAHHHSAPHGTCQSNAVASHACSSLRKRETAACCKSFRKTCCSSQGHFASGFGGLTEIVTE